VFFENHVSKYEQLLIFMDIDSFTLHNILEPVFFENHVSKYEELLIFMDIDGFTLHNILEPVLGRPFGYSANHH
jgi:hypothetical protein